MCVIADAEGPSGHRRHHGRRRLRDLRRARTRSCSRPPTSRAPRSCARRRRSACAPTARTAGRRASTRPRADRLARRRAAARRALRRPHDAAAARRLRRPAAARAAAAAHGPRSRTSPALEVSLARAVEILDRLGFDPRAGQGTIDVRVPTTRFLDVTREIDVIEEVARIYGLEHVPVAALGRARAAASPPPARAPHRRRRVLRRGADRGADALVRPRRHARPARPRRRRSAPRHARGR